MGRSLVAPGIFRCMVKICFYICVCLILRDDRTGDLSAGSNEAWRKDRRVPNLAVASVLVGLA